MKINGWLAHGLQSKQHAAPPASPFSGLADAGDRGHRPAPASKPPAAPTEFGQARAALQSSAPLPWLPCRDKYQPLLPACPTYLLLCVSRYRSINQQVTDRCCCAGSEPRSQPSSRTPSPAGWADPSTSAGCRGPARRFWCARSPTRCWRRPGTGSCPPSPSLTSTACTCTPRSTCTE